MDIINVWYAGSSYSEFSNLTGRPFEYKGVKYISVEHAYQTLKSGKFDQRTYSRYVGRGTGIKFKGKKANVKIKYRLMECLMNASFLQNHKILEKLVNTKGRITCRQENSKFWKKYIPKILEKIRKDYG